MVEMIQTIKGLGPVRFRIFREPRTLEMCYSMRNLALKHVAVRSIEQACWDSIQNDSALVKDLHTTMRYNLITDLRQRKAETSYKPQKGVSHEPQKS